MEYKQQYKAFLESLKPFEIELINRRFFRMKQIFILKENSEAITGAKDLFNNIQKIDIDFTQENFILFSLDTQNKIIASEIIFKGGLNGCLIDPKTLFRKALLNNANSIIIAHNHPSGNLKPSNEDRSIFNKLKRIGKDLQLNLLDSIIFNENQFYTMRALE